jgi:biotin synthase-related radical SAM superfamily protein
MPRPAAARGRAGAPGWALAVHEPVRAVSIGPGVRRVAATGKALAQGRPSTACPPSSALSRRERQLMDILYRRGRATAAEVMRELERISALVAKAKKEGAR